MASKTDLDFLNDLLSSDEDEEDEPVAPQSEAPSPSAPVVRSHQINKQPVDFEQRPDRKMSTPKPTCIGKTPGDPGHSESIKRPQKKLSDLPCPPPNKPPNQQLGKGTEDSQTTVAKPSGFCMPYIEKEKSKNLVGRVQEDYEEFSGLRVRNRIVGILELRRNMKGRTMLRIDKLAGFPRKQLEEEHFEWLSIGVVQAATPVKTSSNGKKFRILTMGNLKNVTVNIFLFGDAYSAHTGLTMGSLVIVLNPKILPSKEKMSFSLSVQDGGQVVKIGDAKDFAICAGTRKSDGRRCTMAVNISKGKYCEYHVAAQFKKASGGRMDLAGSSGVLGRAHGASKTVGRGSGTVQNFFGVQRRNLSQGTYNQFGGALGPHGRANFVVNQRGSVVSGNSRQGSRYTAQREELKSNLEKNIRENNIRIGAGARNIATVLGIKSDALDVGLKARSRKKPGASRRSTDPIGAMFRRVEEKSMRAQNKTRVMLAERLRKSGATFGEVDPNDPDGVEKASEQAYAAMAKAGFKGPRRTDLLGKRGGGSFSGGDGTLGKKQRIETILAQKSKHAVLGGNLRSAERDQALDDLAAKDALAEKMVEQTEITVTAYCCVTCNYLLERAHSSCLSQGHSCHEIKAKKRCFKCVKCGRREHVLGAKFFKAPCQNCQGSSWRMTSFSSARDVKEKKFSVTGKSTASFLTGRYHGGGP